MRVFNWGGISKGLLCIAAATLLACTANNNKDEYRKTPKRVDIGKIIDQVCETNDTVSFQLKDYEMVLGCAGKDTYIANSLADSNIDYTSSNYATGLSPIPIVSLKFRHEDPLKYKHYTNAPPPGTMIILFSGTKEKPYQRCADFNEGRVWCRHLLHIPETDLTVRMQFNAGRNAVYPLWEKDKKIRPDKYPWAYYTEDEWPQLYAQTERFVKSIIN